MMQKANITIYVRVNTTDQSCELQKQEIFKFLDPKDWQIVKVYEEQKDTKN